MDFQKANSLRTHNSHIQCAHAFVSGGLECQGCGPAARVSWFFSGTSKELNTHRDKRCKYSQKVRAGIY